MKRALLLIGGLIVAVIVVVGVIVWVQFSDPSVGPPADDEAKARGLTPADFPPADRDFFHDMDGGGQMSPAEIRGRNTWLAWTGGDEAFWDYLANHSFGTFDLLKTVSSFPCSDEQRAQLETALQKDKGLRARLPDYAMYQRSVRFKYLGLMNEPDFRQASRPDKYGLCLDESTRATPDFDEKVYGRATGVLGLRVYDNPNFMNNPAAQQQWEQNKTRFYTDPRYYSDSTLVRPYRVGMSCAFCHISHHPLSPPVDPESPAFANLSGTIGAQYFWFGRIFAPNLKPDSFLWHLIDSSKPGAVDTSFVPTDHINNPRAMNAVFDLPARLAAANRFHQEEIDGGALDLPEVKTHIQNGKAIFGVPHILWDGADSVGVDAALTRVYINIGEYHQEWIRHVQPVVGGFPQTPITVKAAQEHSTYWNATEARAGDMAAYLIKAGAPMHLKDAPGGAAALVGSHSPADYDGLLTRGKTVFADTCARCHSSKIPKPAIGLDDGVACNGEHYRECWDRYWTWTQTDDFKQKMRAIVQDPAFLQDNYLSTDARIPVDLLQTEICSSMATNAMSGYVWDNFSSSSYKHLPAAPAMTLNDPVTGESFPFTPLGGGRGYQRVPSLISVWATAPYLHNNEVGIFTSDPSTAGRLKAFDDGIGKLLYLDKQHDRGHCIRVTRQVGKRKEDLPDFLKGIVCSDDDYGDSYSSYKGPYGSEALRPNVAASSSYSYTKPETYDNGQTWLTMYTSSLPHSLQLFFGEGLFSRSLRTLFRVDGLVHDGMIQIGPIPEGTPVNLLGNLNVDRNDPRFSAVQLLRFVGAAKKRLKEIQDRHLDPTQSAALLKELEPQLVSISTCPDFVVDRGHDFGKALSYEDKKALIEFVKTF